VGARRPAAAAAFAGFYLLAALIFCVGAGLLLGWLAGSIVIGGIVGALLGVPLSFYLVYREYRDI
jgi:uncharacterized membrane protein